MAQQCFMVLDWGDGKADATKDWRKLDGIFEDKI